MLKRIQSKYTKQHVLNRFGKILINRINILSIDWVIDSCKQNEIADCKTYCVFKNALNSVKTPKKRVREDNPKSIANTSVNISMKSYESDLNTYLAQYQKIQITTRQLLLEVLKKILYKINAQYCKKPILINYQ